MGLGRNTRIYIRRDPRPPCETVLQMEEVDLANRSSWVGGSRGGGGGGGGGWGWDLSSPVQAMCKANSPFFPYHTEGHKIPLMTVISFAFHMYSIHFIFLESGQLQCGLEILSSSLYVAAIIAINEAL